MNLTFIHYKYSNMVIGTLTADGWAVTFGTARRGLGGAGPQCTNHCIFFRCSAVLECPLTL